MHTMRVICGGVNEENMETNEELKMIASQLLWDLMKLSDAHGELNRHIYNTRQTAQALVDSIQGVKRDDDRI